MNSRPRAASRAAALLSLALGLLALTLAPSAHAQGIATSPPPVRSSVDGNGVDLITGALVVSSPQLSIGQGGGALSYTRFLTPSGWVDNVTGTVNFTGAGPCPTTGTTTVSFGGGSEAFTWSGTAYVNAQGGGSTLSCTSGNFTYVTADGVTVVFNPFAAFSPAYANGGRPVTATYPDGKIVTYTYNTATVVSVRA